MPKVRVLVVDDAVVARQLISKALAADTGIEVVGVAANGHIALAKIPQVNPDLIVLDLEMPEMSGLEILSVIRKTYPHLPVIIFSASTKLGASATLDALALGATDYATKPSHLGREAAMQYTRQQLVPKIKTFGLRDVKKQPVSPLISIQSPPQAALSAVALSPVSFPRRSPVSANKISLKHSPVQVVAIGVSTGGPNALAALLPKLPGKLPVPIVIVQHMPPLFTQRLAERLTHQGQIPVSEGITGAILQPGQAWLAPGDFHMSVERDDTAVKLQIHQAPPENSCRPAVDVLFRSVVQVYGHGTLGVILTGMGQDGLHGCQCIREAGGQVLVQDEASSVVWGMPGMVAQAGLANQILPLADIANEIVQRVQGGGV